MADIRAFHAMRYTKSAGEAKELTCPPYDIISEAERAAFLERNPHNVIRLELPRGEEPYKTAGKTLHTWLSDGTLRCDKDAGLYIYEEEFKTDVDHGEVRSLKGIVCLVRVEDFSAGVVLPHEETLSKAIVNDKQALEAFRADFAPRKLYIADGHHRYETAIHYRDYCRENAVWAPGSEFVMMTLVDMAHPGLVVFPTHRLVRGIEGFSAEKVLESCGEYFQIETLADKSEIEPRMKNAYDAGQKAFVFVYKNGDRMNYVLLILKDAAVMEEFMPEKSEASRGLDVSVLHTLILERALGIDRENMASQKNLTYTRDLNEALSMVESDEMQCAFILNPTRVEEIGAVAAAGEKMPQKSTYFYPKLITGLVMNNLETPVED